MPSVIISLTRQTQFIENKTMKTIAAFILLACLIAVGVKGEFDL